MNPTSPSTSKSALIIEAFTTLLKAKPYSQIKVINIIRESGVSHQTFYRLFTDKDALARDICIQDFSLFFLIHGDSASWKVIVIDILTVIKQKSAFYRRLLADPTGIGIIKDAIREVSTTYSGSPCSAATLSIWLCMLEEWSKQLFKDSPEQAYANLLYHLPVNDVLTGEELDRAIERYEQIRLNEYNKFRSWEKRHH